VLQGENLQHFVAFGVTWYPDPIHNRENKRKQEKEKALIIKHLQNRPFSFNFLFLHIFC
jgi:hypothetical protein